MGLTHDQCMISVGLLHRGQLGRGRLLGPHPQSGVPTQPTMSLHIAHLPNIVMSSTDPGDEVSSDQLILTPSCVVSELCADVICDVWYAICDM